MSNDQDVTTESADRPEPSAAPEIPAEGKVKEKSEPSSNDEESTEEQGETTEESDTSDEDQSESDDQDEKEEQEDSKPKKKKGFKDRIKRFQRRLSEKDQRIEELERQISQGKKPLSESSPEIESSIEASDDEPKEEDFDTHKDYVKALAKHTYQKEKEVELKKSKEAQLKSEFQSKRQVHDERVQKFKESTPDYEEVIADFIEDHGDVGFSPTLEQSILESSDGPALIYELAKNPDELKRINSLGPIAAAREIGKMEARIESAKSSEEKPKPKTTKAPPPPKALGSRGGSVEKRPQDMDADEYMAWRKRQKKG